MWYLRQLYSQFSGNIPNSQLSLKSINIACLHSNLINAATCTNTHHSRFISDTRRDTQYPGFIIEQPVCLPDDLFGFLYREIGIDGDLDIELPRIHRGRQLFAYYRHDTLDTDHEEEQ